ncbi:MULTISPECIES: PaaI family thioesterase [Streptomycetaceae]|uniref:PaaI family thioesterase n=1 Tax=Streptomycetaceae TaxID=2062 RepID=UPI0030092011
MSPAPHHDPAAAPALDLEAARATLGAQPFSRLLGAELSAFGGGAAVLEVAVRDDLRQQNGFLHGGVLAYAADNAITFAAGSVLGPAVLTGGLTVQYLRPGTGVRLVARAQTVQAGRRQAVCRCDLYAVAADGAETLCAVAQGTVLRAAAREE